MKTWMIALIAIAGGIGLWLYSRRKAVAVTTFGTADIGAIIQERPAGVTVSEALKGVTTELVKPGLEEFGVNINPAVDVVARQAGMLDSDIRALARRELEGQDIDQQLVEEADTYKIDEVVLRDMVTAQQSQFSQSYQTYAQKRASGEYTKPWYTYQHEQLSVYKQETEALVEEFHERRESGETFQQYERRTTGTTTTTEAPTRTPTPTVTPEEYGRQELARWTT